MSRSSGLLVTLLALALMVWALVQFGVIWTYGSVMVYEDNLYVRGIETALFSGLIAILIHKLVRVYKTKERG